MIRISPATCLQTPLRAKGSRRALPCLVAALLMPAAALAAADPPSRAEVARARTVCLAQEHASMELERGAGWCTDDARLIQARHAADQSCAHADSLMVAAGMEQPPAKPQPAPPTPSITVIEKVRLGQDAESAGTAQFAAMEADRRCRDTRSPETTTP